MTAISTTTTIDTTITTITTLALLLLLAPALATANGGDDVGDVRRVPGLTLYPYGQGASGRAELQPRRVLVDDAR